MDIDVILLYYARGFINITEKNGFANFKIVCDVFGSYGSAQHKIYYP